MPVRSLPKGLIFTATQENFQRDPAIQDKRADMSTLFLLFPTHKKRATGWPTEEVVALRFENGICPVEQWQAELARALR